jgi:hypothetical protein
MCLNKVCLKYSISVQFRDGKSGIYHVGFGVQILYDLSQLLGSGTLLLHSLCTVRHRYLPFTKLQPINTPYRSKNGWNKFLKTCRITADKHTVQKEKWVKQIIKTRRNWIPNSDPLYVIKTHVAFMTHRLF